MQPHAKDNFFGFNLQDDELYGRAYINDLQDTKNSSAAKILVMLNNLVANSEVLSSLTSMVLLFFPLRKLKQNLLCFLKIQKMHKSRGWQKIFRSKSHSLAKNN